MAKYVLLIYGDESSGGDMTPEEGAAMSQAYDDYTKWLVDKGWMQGGEGLQPTSTATTVRVRDGQTVTTDGPFAETKEQLGGFYLVECDDLDQAIDAASRIPGAKHGTVEVRPVMVFDTA
jgi:hypothetical protein